MTLFPFRFWPQWQQWSSGTCQRTDPAGGFRNKTPPCQLSRANFRPRTNPYGGIRWTFLKSAPLAVFVVDIYNDTFATGAPYRALLNCNHKYPRKRDVCPQSQFSLLSCRHCVASSMNRIEDRCFAYVLHRGNRYAMKHVEGVGPSTQN